MLLHHVYTTLAALAVLPTGLLAWDWEPIDEQDYSAQQVVKKLGLVPNPEKGYFIQTFEDPVRTEDNRTISTLIYYLLEGDAGESVWHKLDAYEVWHYYAGAPLTLSLSWNNGTACERHVLGPNVFNKRVEERPQVVVPKDMWQSARSHGDWTLVGTTMAPGFSPDGTILEKPDFVPKGCCKQKKRKRSARSIRGGR
ncbi:cupin domain protein [Metarhizium robertsii]|uniref:Cupin superfamily protein n=2 Tax=Metarhizium robertsii TaxID=568076 RepID=E9F930_METRA|nr:cupin superfamily protein [Metarhizium robertsii ARSEF 23]EFY95798.1 cupin superfamily protein [Metarhizium robertsii ARSEF 23]EXU96943.1 cupin domain protein [Metarhizium robertsii]